MHAYKIIIYTKPKQILSSFFNKCDLRGLTAEHANFFLVFYKSQPHDYQSQTCVITYDYAKDVLSIRKFKMKQFSLLNGYHREYYENFFINKLFK